ncbi:MAG TPA: hypothetical protein VNT20_06115 [Flavisolibacter sp.]|jgi:hypothetical protein|nr:hypothetical protein [Flavisolibacter sp.]
MKEKNSIGLIRKLLLFFIIVLFLSGLTAIPVEAELSFLLGVFSSSSQLYYWLEKVLSAYKNVNHDTPFLLYGYDWLALAHFILAILFIGPYRNPIKNIWVIEFGLIACVLIFPLAFIAGSFRGIPIGWRLIDCSFGVFGSIPLWICYSKTKTLISKNYSIK